MIARCRCGHGAETHDHFRPGTDCSQCWCPAYNRSRPPQTRGPMAIVVLAIVNELRARLRRGRHR